jgi:hypothetical protein
MSRGANVSPWTDFARKVDFLERTACLRAAYGSRPVKEPPIDSARDAVYCYCACQETPPLLFNLNRRNTFGVRPDWSS